MSIEDQRRKAFEAWWLSDENWELRISCSQGWAEFVWNAAIDSVVVELPGKFADSAPYACYEGGWNDGIDEAKDAIHAAGVKTK